jgi:hypothetical protein
MRVLGWLAMSLLIGACGSACGTPSRSRRASESPDRPTESTDAATRRPSTFSNDAGPGLRGNTCPPGLRDRDGVCLPADGMPCFGGCTEGYAAGSTAEHGSSTQNEIDRTAVAAALSELDLRRCLADAGRPHGHVRISFLPNGSVGGVIFDKIAPDDLPTRRCVAEQIAWASIPSFRGASVTVGHSF